MSLPPHAPPTTWSGRGAASALCGVRPSRHGQDKTWGRRPGWEGRGESLPACRSSCLGCPCRMGRTPQRCVRSDRACGRASGRARARARMCARSCARAVVLVRLLLWVRGSGSEGERNLGMRLERMALRQPCTASPNNCATLRVAGACSYSRCQQLETPLQIKSVRWRSSNSCRGRLTTANEPRCVYTSRCACVRTWCRC